MAGRLTWIAAGVAATVAGIAVHSGDFIEISSDGVRSGHERKYVDHAEKRVARVQERIAEKIADEEGNRIKIVTGKNGDVEIDKETARAFASQVGEVVRANIALSLLEIKEEPGSKRLEAARQRAEVAEDTLDAMSDDIDRMADRADEVSEAEREALRERIKRRVTDAAQRTQS